MKITTKTKKDDLINEAVARKLLTAEEAKSWKAKSLYELLKDDENHGGNIILTKESDTVEDVASSDNNIVVIEDKKTSRKRPPKKSETKDTDDNILDDNKCVTTLAEKISSLKIATGEDEESILTKIGMSKEEFESVKDVAIGEDKEEDLIQNKPIVSDAFSVADYKEIIKLSEKDEVTNEDVESDEELKNEIIASMVEMKESINNMSEEIKSLKSEHKKSTISNGKIYNAILNITNEVANTGNEDLLFLYSKLKNVLKMFSCFEDGEKPIDMPSLIKVQAPNEVREEYDLNDEDHSYTTGACINYINGKPMQTVGTTKKQYEVCKEWYDDCVSVVNSTLEILDNINGMPLQERREAKAELDAIIEKWVEEWDVNPDEFDTDLIMDIMTDLCEDKDYHKAMSNLVAVIDEILPYII